MALARLQWLIQPIAAAPEKGREANVFLGFALAGGFMPAFFFTRRDFRALCACAAAHDMA